MKAVVLILALAPFFCFSQKENKPIPAATKPSTTDCPTWNKKSTTKNKADYYQQLRSRKPIANQPATNNTTETQPKSVDKKTENSEEKISLSPIQKKTKTEQTSVVQSNKSEGVGLTHSQENSGSNEAKNDPSKPEKLTFPSDEKPLIIPQEKKEDKKSDIANPEDKKKNDDIKEEKEKNVEKERFKRKISRWFSRDSSKARKSKNNSKCPSFS